MAVPTTDPIKISIPAGKSVIVNFATNASFTQSFSITNSDNVVECSGSGSGVGPVVQNSQVFTATLGGEYAVAILANGNAQEVLESSSSSVYNGTVYAQSYNFVSEDASDSDYNDTFLSINWFQYNS